MIIEIGHFALVLALFVAVLQGTIPLVGAHTGRAAWMALSVPAALAQFFLLGLSFAALSHAFITSDFSLLIVASNSHSLKPLLYKISGVWGNHEGSMLMWVLILALYGAAIAVWGTNLRQTLKVRILADQGLVAVGFILFILLTSNPFDRLFPAPLDGRGLNPLLQDPGLAFHPPLFVSWLCGLLHNLFLCRCCTNRRQGGSCLGAMGSSLGACRMGLSNYRNCARLLVGLLRARLGRLVVLGSGGECIFYALACGHRIAPFGHRVGEKGYVKKLDHIPRHHCLCHEPAWYLSGSLRSTYLRACLCFRPLSRCVHLVVARRHNWRGVRVVCVARADPQRIRVFPANLSRGRTSS